MSAHPVPNPGPAGVVRQHERVACSLPSRLRPGIACREQVRFARAEDLSVSVVDCSRGGIGIRATTFVPQGTTIDVGVQRRDGSVIQVSGQVQRVGMVDRTPHYYLGVAFAGDTQASTVEALLTLARTESGAAS